MRPPLSRYCVAPRAGCRAVLAYYSAGAGRYYPVAALGPPHVPRANPYLRLSFYPLAYLTPPTP